MKRPTTIPSEAVWSEELEGWVVGDPDGTGRVTQYRPDGTKLAEWDCVDGENHGECLRFHETGELSQRMRLERGELVGTASAFRATGPSTEPFPDMFPDSVVRIDTEYDHGEALGMKVFDADGNELSAEQVAFEMSIEEAVAEHEADPSEPWAPALPAPPRPANVPEQAELAYANDPQARWELGERIDGEKHGEWRYWALNGNELMESVLDHGTVVSSEMYRPGKRLAARQRRLEDGQTVYEGFSPDGTPSCTIRLSRYEPGEEAIDKILEEKAFDASGELLVGREWERSADGTVISSRQVHRGSLLFENVEAEGGREIRLYDQGQLAVTVRIGDDPAHSTAVAPAYRAEPFEIDATGIDASSTDDEIASFLPGRLFAATIEATPRPEAVAKFAERCPWAEEVEESSPVPHTSIANLMTALTSKVPYAAAFGQVGLGNLLSPDFAGEDALVVVQRAVLPLLEIVSSEQASWLAGVIEELELPAASLRPVLDCPHPELRLRALQWLGAEEAEAVVPFLDDADAAARTMAACALAQEDPDLARDRVIETLAQLAAGPTPEHLEGEFRGLVAMAADALGAAELFEPLASWYGEDGGPSEVVVGRALLALMRDPEAEVDPRRAAEVLRTMAARHEGIEGPVEPGLGLPRHVAALADRVEREGTSIIPDEEAEFPIGEVTLPSGNLVLVDMGALGQWSHDAPHFADMSGSSWAGSIGASRGDYFDMQATGPDANAALAAFLRQHGGTYLFDVNEPQSKHGQEMFAKVVAAEKLDARLERAPVRIGHGQRVRMLAETGVTHADFSFAHVNVVSVHGLASDKTMPVVGKWSFDDTWEYVSLVCRPTQPVSSDKIDSLGVEEARMIFADAGALGSWEHERSADGLLDFLFWGGRDDEFGQRFGLERMRNGQYGWLDLPFPAMPDGWVEELAAAAEDNELVLDLRPHSSHYDILRHAWANDQGAGTATIGGALMCGMFTSVGDGSFPVVLERDADGEICRVTIRIYSDDEDDDDDIDFDDFGDEDDFDDEDDLDDDDL